MFIQIIQGRCSREDEAKALFDRWRSELAPGAQGWLGGTFGFTDDGMLCSVVRFESKQAADANSARPEQGAWWAEMEKLYDGPVTFHDSDDVTLLMDGGSDQAGFVQIIQGKVADAEMLRSMMVEDAEMLHEARPEILGGTLAIAEDGTFTETIAFTDEDSARKGEQMEMPAEVREQMERSMRDVKYMDLHHPWFASA
jgi:hypothetical protein